MKTNKPYESPLNFSLVGVAGYVAPRHIKAIKETGNRLVSAYDKSDSVGIMDSYFPHTSFFTEQELFDRHNSKLKGTPDAIDFVTVCTPNYLHDAHCRYALRLGADVVCEKPLCLNPWNIDALGKVEKETGHHIFNILQLRLHPSLIALKEKIARAPQNKIFDVDLTYVTSRGLWYYASWKGDERKSGGIVTNIGIHFYDMLIWLFGAVKKQTVHLYRHDRCAGLLELEHANVRYILSINEDLLPQSVKEQGERTYRVLSFDGEEVFFSTGFTGLHTESYRQILQGNGFSIQETRPAIQLVHDIRHAQPVGLVGDYHPMAKLPLAPHPFGWKI